MTMYDTQRRTCFRTIVKSMSMLGWLLGNTAAHGGPKIRNLIRNILAAKVAPRPPWERGLKNNMRKGLEGGYTRRSVQPTPGTSKPMRPPHPRPPQAGAVDKDPRAPGGGKNGAERDDATNCSRPRSPRRGSAAGTQWRHACARTQARACATLSPRTARAMPAPRSPEITEHTPPAGTVGRSGVGRAAAPSRTVPQQGAGARGVPRRPRTGSAPLRTGQTRPTHSQRSHNPWGRNGSSAPGAFAHNPAGPSAASQDGAIHLRRLRNIRNTAAKRLHPPQQCHNSVALATLCRDEGWSNTGATPCKLETSTSWR